MTAKLCPKGHVKTWRAFGLYCATCAHLRAKAREEEAYRNGTKQRPAPRWAERSTPTDRQCVKGHTLVRKPSGQVFCQVCANTAKRAKAKGCTHYLADDYDHIINDRGHDICLMCLCRDANEE